MKKLASIILFSLSISTQAQIADSAENISPLLIGEKIPNTTLVNSEGKSFETDKVFKQKTVLIFYRGGWCPFCNTQLSEMQDIENQITELGYQIVAISPDSPAFLKETESKDKLNYQVLSDSDGSLMKAVGIAFAAPEKYSEKLGKYSGGKNKQILPVPTVYVLNDKAEIEYMYVNPNYKTRLNSKMLLAVLKNL